MTPHEILVTAFSALSVEQLRNLQYHLERKTPICCGNNFAFFADGRGGA